VSLSNIDEIISDAKQGKMFILVDDEGRENEGDLVIPAQMADSKTVNFMAMYGRGLICLALDRKRVEELDLPLMAQNNKSRHQTAFTVSIEAREGITTGISAADRAKTIADAINPNKTKYDIVSPGHIFPLVAREGGVLARAGHTEASVDIAKLAGLNPSGVICEIMNEDGTMARLPDLIKFAEKHSLKIATIADLIKYRRVNEKLVEKISETQLEISSYGHFTAHIYKSKIDNSEHIALIKGDIKGKKNIPVRMHQLDFMSDILEVKNSPKNGVLASSFQVINNAGQGAIVILAKTSKQFITNSLDKLFSNKNKEKVSDNTIRDYGVGAQILIDLGINDMQLITNTGKHIIALDGYDIKINNFINV